MFSLFMQIEDALDICFRTDGFSQKSNAANNLKASHLNFNNDGVLAAFKMVQQFYRRLDIPRKLIGLISKRWFPVHQIPSPGKTGKGTSCF